MEKAIIVFIKLCIKTGNLFLMFIDKVMALVFWLLYKLRELLTVIFGAILHPLSRLSWTLFRKRPKRKQKFFSLNHYLLFYRIKYFAFGFLVAILMLSLKSSLDFIENLPNPTMVENYRSSLSTHILSRDDKLLYEIFREENRTPVKLATLPSYVRWATIAIEDKDFYRHNGVSLFGGILRAVKETALQKKLQGGSTITQQLVKSSLLTPERTIARKVREIILALLVEKKYSKDEILEMYLNQVPYGGTAWGIEEASKMYFGKSAGRLTLSEAAFLAGLPQAPSAYSPYINPKAALNRQRSVLRNMYDEGYIKKEEYDRAIRTNVDFKSPSTRVLAPHFVFYVKNLLEEEYGQKMVQGGGLKVYTTLDYKIQQEAEKVLNEELSKIESMNVGNGSVLVTRPSTGEILAMVGSRDFFDGRSGAFNVTTAARQPGSSVKPLTYTLALKQGMSAASIILDTPTVFGAEGAEPYRPVNYDNSFHGPIPLRYALANSYNVPAVKVLQEIGVDNLISFAKKLGVENWSENRDRYGLSLTLGGGEVTMLEMATAFGSIRNLGVRVDLNPILRIENDRGEVIYERKTKGTRVINEEEPFIVSDILADNVARSWAFGPNSPLNFGNSHLSVKTGTTDEKKDNWTIGFTRPTLKNRHADVLVGVWVGNNDNQPMHPSLTSGITGAAPIWRKIIEELVSKEYLDEELYIPRNLEKKVCYYGRPEYFVIGTAKAVNCSTFRVTPTINKAR